MRKKLLLIGIPLALILLVAGFLSLRWWWYRGYSRGTRTGVVRKLSYKGSPLCKYFSGELVLVGSSAMNPQVWEFSVEDPDGPIAKKLQAAERHGRRVTLEYRQDLGNKGKLLNCSPSDYYITGIAEE